MGHFSERHLTREDAVVGKLTSVVEYDDKILAIGWLKSKIEPGEAVFTEGQFQVRELPVN